MQLRGIESNSTSAGVEFRSVIRSGVTTCRVVMATIRILQQIRRMTSFQNAQPVLTVGDRREALWPSLFPGPLLQSDLAQGSQAVDPGCLDHFSIVPSSSLLQCYYCKHDHAPQLSIPINVVRTPDFSFDVLTSKLDPMNLPHPALIQALEGLVYLIRKDAMTVASILADPSAHTTEEFDLSERVTNLGERCLRRNAH